MASPDASPAPLGPAAALDHAASVLNVADSVVRSGIERIGSVDTDQVLAYDVAHAASAVQAARVMLDYGRHGDAEARVACAYLADALHDLAQRVFGREELWGIGVGALDAARDFVAEHRAPATVAAFADLDVDRHLDEDMVMVAETFRRFAEDRIMPVAEHVHRHNGDVPEDIIGGVAELGAFGLAIPEEYGGSSTGSDTDQLAMVIATEELSRASLGIGGSLITRPEILTRALLKGGTDEQKKRLLPLIASGETMVAVAVTEPDYGSDVAGVRLAARKVPGGWIVDGTKTWCTFAARADLLMLLARTDPATTDHRGLSLFVVPKPRGDGHGFVLDQATGADGGAPGSGRIEGRPIDTIGYRGMHSYELSFSDWFISDENQVGGEAGVGRGFYLQMEGFENGRLQTAARAVGIMQAAFDAACAYASDRKVFGRPIADYELTQVKLGRMAVLIQAARQFAYHVARLMAAGQGMLEASMVKAYVCRTAEWVTREAQQIHGGMGYAEEYAVSRYFVDARVLSIFEGADETLCLKVIARRLADKR
jgi:(2S)-methylsuccinyl-CoA dehydrogenase